MFVVQQTAKPQSQSTNSTHARDGAIQVRRRLPSDLRRGARGCALLQPSAAIRAQPVKVKPACVPVKPPQSVTPSPPPPAASLPPSVPASPSTPAPTTSPPQLPPTPVTPPTPPPPQQPAIPVTPPTPPPPQLPATPVTPASPPPPAQITECMSPLMGLMPCMGYLTNTTVSAPPATCCGGFKTLVDNAPICLCHGLNGDINKIMPAPMDFMRMMSLPGSCSVPLPLQTLAQCSTVPVPPLNPPAAPSPKPSK